MNISEAFKTSVRNSIAKGNHARWGEAESVDAIGAAIVAACMESGLDAAEAKAVADNCSPFVRRVVNPSAFAQDMEKLPDGTGLDAEGKPETHTYNEAADTVVEFVALGKHVAHPAYIRRAKRGTGGAKGKVSV